MNTTAIFDALWNEYIQRTPSAEKIKNLFTSKKDQVYNDHVAFRTFDDPRVNIDVLAIPFINTGYIECGTYHFKTKKLFAKHFEHPTEKNAPKVFISQLKTNEFSSKLQLEVKKMIDEIPKNELDSATLIFKGRLWKTPSYELYTSLKKESEYAAWLYVNGFCANHFTVNINKLTNFVSIQEVNEFLKANGFKMNASGGEIKGTPEQLLEQSSVLADIIPVKFKETIKNITSCYYEFAYRHPDNDGCLFSGFISDSADKIFESTDMKLQVN